MKLPRTTDIALTIVPGRSPELKIHTSLAEAKKALLYKTHHEYTKDYSDYVQVWSQDMEIYVPLNDGWVLVSRVHHNTAVDAVDWAR